MKKWVEKYLSKDDIQKISEAVTKAESHTSGEIVPMIVLSSSATGHVFFSVTMFMMVLGMVALIPLSDHLMNGETLYILPAQALVFFLVSLWLAKLHLVQRFFTPNHDRSVQVWRRALSEFTLNKINKSESHTGILIFVSIMERKAVILADEVAMQKCPPNIWKEIVHEMSGSLKRGDWALGFEKAITRCAETLGKHLPASQHVRNELPNSLIIKE